MTKIHSHMYSRKLKQAVLSPVLIALITVGLMLLTASCATVGEDFPTSEVAKIQIGKTTQQEIKVMFGSPWRTGIEDGKRTWTYGRYHYQVFGETSTKDLVVRFDNQGIVTSYSFNTTDHQE